MGMSELLDFQFNKKINLGEKKKRTWFAKGKKKWKNISWELYLVKTKTVVI